MLCRRRCRHNAYSTMTESRSSYVVVDGRSKQIFSPDPPFQMLGVIAIDLPHDLWRDFSFFMEEAKKAEDSGDPEKRYRFLRVSLLCLFAHVDAFFGMIIESVKKDADFRDYKRTATPKLRASPDWPRSEHGQFVVLYSGFMKAVHDKTLPAIDWSIKPLRNLLAHPSGVRGVTVADLYDLALDDLLAAALSFQSWIMAAAQLRGIAYEVDTASMARELGAAISKSNKSGIKAKRF
jgi:hypothetical protein